MMGNKKYLMALLVPLCLWLGCQGLSEAVMEAEKPSHWVGDIHFDSKSDDVNFTLCDSTNIIHRRNALNYPGGKEAIKKECLERFKFQSSFESFSGFIMIRFIINCKNKKGRYRVQSLDFDFSLKECPVELKEHLLSIVKGLNGWTPRLEKDAGADFSKYLNFKIENGKIENIRH